MAGVPAGGRRCCVWSRVPSRATRVSALSAIGAASACAALPLLAWSEPILPIHGSSLQGAVTSVSREFTPLGAMLIPIGLAVLWSVPRNRRALAALVAGLLAWFWLVPRSGLEIVSVPFSICGWAAVAVALAWLTQLMRPGAAPAASSRSSAFC